MVQSPPKDRLVSTISRAVLSVLLAGALMVWTVGPAGGAGASVHPSDVAVPPGVTAGVVVFDRETGQVTDELNPDMRFRSASVVKLLLILDHLWGRTPGDMSDADRTRMEQMLRSSDDAAATHFWNANGRSAIVERMVERLDLTGTGPPPAAYPGYWGYVAITPADTVRTYRHILDVAPSATRDFIMSGLHAATRCGTDGFDQAFGLPSVFTRPYAIKQGWSGFARSGGCGDGFATSSTSPATAASDLDLVSEALHTTGTVGQDDRSIVAVYTLHPDGTTYGAAYSDINRLVRSLDPPGADKLVGTTFGTWGSGVRVRNAPNTDSQVIGRLPQGVEILVGCQRRGEVVSVPPYQNAWWAYLPAYDGYMTNIYVRNPDNKLPGVPDC